MLIIRCNNCDTQFQCTPDRAGERVECPGCGAHVHVPFDAPDLDAIQERAALNAKAGAAAEPVETRKFVTEEEPPRREIIQASAHDLYEQRMQQHVDLMACVDKMVDSLHSLRARLRTISTLLFFILLLLLASCLSILILTMRIFARL